MSTPLSGQPHAGMQALLAQLQALRAGQPNRYGLPFRESRAQLEKERAVWLDDGPVCVRETRQVRHAGRDLTVHVERPGNATGGTRLVYLHGGGWCVGSHATHHNIVRRLAQALGCEAWSIDYALAPEAPFPAGLLDCVAAVDLAQQDGARVTLAGDSAGANLALGAAVRLRALQRPLPVALLLFYGVWSAACNDASMLAYGDGRYGLSLAAHRRYLEAYFPAGPTALPRALALPLDAPDVTAAEPAPDLTGLPPCWLAAVELDILHDQSVRMAEALQAAGNRVELVEVPGVIHGFLSYGKVLPEVGQVLGAAAAFARVATAGG